MFIYMDYYFSGRTMIDSVFNDGVGISSNANDQNITIANMIRNVMISSFI